MKKNKRITLEEINHEHIMDLMNEIKDLRQAIVKLQNTVVYLEPSEKKELTEIQGIEEELKKLYKLRTRMMAWRYSCGPEVQMINIKIEAEKERLEFLKSDHTQKENQYETLPPMQVTEKALNFLRRSDDFKQEAFCGKRHYYFDGVPIEIMP